MFILVLLLKPIIISILKVTAQEVGSNNKKDLVIKSDKGRLSDEEIERIVEDAKKYKEMDIKIAKDIEAKNYALMKKKMEI